jgi:hypothetical protein
MQINNAKNNGSLKKPLKVSGAAPCFGCGMQCACGLRFVIRLCNMTTMHEQSKTMAAWRSHSR